MKFLTASFLILAAVTVDASCNEDEHHMLNGGYFVFGPAGASDVIDLESSVNAKLPNTTWTTGIDYPYGQLVRCNKETDRRCSDECATTGCPVYETEHSCSIMRFCEPEGESGGSSVYLMPDFKATESCKFSKAKYLGQTLDGNGGVNACFDYVFEEDHEFKTYYFASKEGCEDGQRVAVDIEDAALRVEECIDYGGRGSRLRRCDCDYEMQNSRITEPCRSAYSVGCHEMSRDDTECCETETCYSRLVDWEDPIGKSTELERRDMCEDDIPGNCYNADEVGVGNDGEGSIDCCTQTCNVCGIELAKSAVWHSCTAYDDGKTTATCGFLSRYDSEPVTCDFAQCAEGTYWHPDGAAFKNYFGK